MSVASLQIGARCRSGRGGCNCRSCRLVRGRVEREFELDWGEPTELALTPVVGVLDPVDDLVAEFGVGASAATVEHAVLREGRNSMAE